MKLSGNEGNERGPAGWGCPCSSQHHAGSSWLFFSSIAGNRVPRSGHHPLSGHTRCSEGRAQCSAPAPHTKHQRTVLALEVTELANVLMEYGKSLRVQFANPQKLRILGTSRRQGSSRLAQFLPRCGQCGKNLVWFSDSSEGSENLGGDGSVALPAPHT